MATANYDLPQTTLNNVKRLSGVKTKREAIIIALNEYVKKKKIERLIQAQGEIKLNWTKVKLKKYRD